MNRHRLILYATAFFLMFVCGLSISHANIDDGLVANYPFNGNANDKSGHGNDGIVHDAMLTADRFGNSESAYLFNGFSSYILVNNSSFLNFGTNDFSVSVWISSPNITDTSMMILQKNGQNLDLDQQYYLRLNDISCALRFMTSEGRGSETALYSNNGIYSDGQWHHIALSFRFATYPHLRKPREIGGHNAVYAGVRK